METAAERKTPWYLDVKFVFLMLTLFGLPALILVWMTPNLTKKTKIITTVITLILTVVFFRISIVIFEHARAWLR